MVNDSEIKIQAIDVSVKFNIRNTKKKKGSGHNQHCKFTALENINLDIRKGEFMVLVGPSGCGKSTFLHVIGGLTVPTGGEIYIDGKKIDGPGLDRGIVFQQYALLPWKTALGNVEFGLEIKNVPRKERINIARHYLSLVGLSSFEDRFPHELSGGMKQRVAIARSLAFDPDVLLMDEPFAALDSQTREILQDELLRIWQKTGKTIVFITHAIEEAVYLGQRVAVMTSKPGRIKQVIDIPLPDARHEIEDLRSDHEFVKIRHDVWELLREEVIKAQEQEQGLGKDEKKSLKVGKVGKAKLKEVV